MWSRAEVIKCAVVGASQDNSLELELGFNRVVSPTP